MTGISKFFGEFKGDGQHLLGISCAGRIEDRNLCKHGHEPGVLFGLGGMGAGIVATDDDKSSHGSNIGRAHQGVCGDIEPHLFHGNGRPFSCIRGYQCIFEGHLFIGRPLDVDLQIIFLFEPDHSRENFRTRGSGVGGDELTSALHQPSRNGIVSKKNPYFF